MSTERLPEQHLALFKQLDSELRAQQSYWQFTPFSQGESPWLNQALDDYLASLDETELAHLEENMQLRYQALGPFIPGLAEPLPDFFKPLEESQRYETPFWLTNGIKGRKADQIQSFSSALANFDLPVLEWCAGKGHLGRIIQFHHQQPVHSVEWQQQLCDAGQALSQGLKLDQEFFCANVLTGEADHLIQADSHAVALHACGDLHLHLIKQVVEQQAAALSLCPCCYQLQRQPSYQPLSQTAKQSELRLSKQDLKLVVQQTVTSGQRVKTLRHTEQQWRLAYDALRADITHKPEYQALASVAKKDFNQGISGFQSFCNWAAEQQGIELPAQVNWQDYLKRGKARYLQVRKMELVRQLFQRRLECWLILDKALFLEEQGYQVNISMLFDYQVSPRNFLLQAQRNSSFNKY